MIDEHVTEVRRALVSVSEKAGLLSLAEALADLGVDVVSTGSTAEVLRAAGFEVTPVGDVTGVPEMLDGRVKTLHPAVHGAILADRRRPEHLQELRRLRIEPIDLVVVNLYPFRDAVAADAPFDEIVEQIDIGGPALLRAAAKNFESVGVVADPRRYADVAAELRAKGGLSRPTRLALAAEAFAHVARYDVAIAQWFAGGEEGVPASLALALEKVGDLRYGENPHQRAALYAASGTPGPRVLQGREMSFNNWLDTQAAVALARMLPAPAAVIVKHNNPCGAACAPTPVEAYRRALACDPSSAFGGVVAFNSPVGVEVAAAMREVFTEVVAARGYDDAALETFAERENLRVVEVAEAVPAGWEVRMIEGGALVQDRDEVTEERSDMKVVSAREPTRSEWDDLLFAWRVAAAVRSNAIVLAAERATVGIGAGQMSRVDAVDIACRKAGDRARGASLASDAFFPFRDGLDRAAQAGVRAVIQPGGSVRDQEVLEAADEHEMAMVLTGRRHFRH